MSVGYGDGRVSIGTTMVGRVAVTRGHGRPRADPTNPSGSLVDAGAHRHHRLRRRTAALGQAIFSSVRWCGTDHDTPLRSFGYVDTQSGSGRARPGAPRV